MKKVVLLASFLVLVVSVQSAPAAHAAEPGDGTPCIEGNELPTYRDVVYGQAPQGVDLELDVWIPEGPGPFPSVEIMHGAFGHGDKSAYDGWAEDICFRGFVVFNVNYRLQCTQDEPPPNPYIDYEMCQGAVAPDQLEDVTMALLWIREHAGEYLGDGTRVASWGASGGGGLASMLGTYNEGDAKVDLVVTWSGLVKLWITKGAADEQRLVDATTRYLGCGLDVCPDKWQNQSAVTWVSTDDPPFYVANGTGETIPLLQAKGLHQKLLQRGIDHTYTVIPEPLHGRGYQDYILPNGLTVQEDTIAFVHDHLGY